MTNEQAALPGETAAAYSEKRWGGPSRLLPARTVAVTTALGRVADNNPRRMLLLVVNVGTAEVRISWDATLTVSNGIPLAPLGGSIELTADEDGELVTYEMLCVSAAAGNNLSVFEVARK